MSLKIFNVLEVESILQILIFKLDLGYMLEN